MHLTKSQLITSFKFKLLLYTSIQNPYLLYDENSIFSNLSKQNIFSTLINSELSLTSLTTRKQQTVLLNLLKIKTLAKSKRLSRYNTAKKRSIDPRAYPVQSIDFLFGNIDPAALVSILRKFKIPLTYTPNEFFFESKIMLSFKREFLMTTPNFFSRQYNFNFYKTWAQNFSSLYLKNYFSCYVAVDLLYQLFSLVFILKFLSSNQILLNFFTSLTNFSSPKALENFLISSRLGYTDFFRLHNFPYYFEQISSIHYKIPANDFEQILFNAFAFELNLGFSPLKTEMVTYLPLANEFRRLPHNPNVSAALRSISDKKNTFDQRLTKQAEKSINSNFAILPVAHYDLHYPFTNKEFYVNNVPRLIARDKLGKQTFFFFSTRKMLEKKKSPTFNYNDFYFTRSSAMFSRLKLLKLYSDLLIRTKTGHSLFTHRASLKNHIFFKKLTHKKLL